MVQQEDSSSIKYRSEVASCGNLFSNFLLLLLWFLCLPEMFLFFCLFVCLFVCLFLGGGGGGARQYAKKLYVVNVGGTQQLKA